MTTISSGSSLDVTSGTTSSGMIILGGGTAIIDGGATVIDTNIASGGTEIVLSGGTASGAEIFGQQLVSSGGVSQDAVVSSDGVNIVQSGGLSIGTTLMSGGSEVVLSGGVAQSAMLVEDDTTETVSAGGTLISASVLAGTVIVAEGGLESASTIQGGTETVLSGGSSLNATVGAGGTETVANGGTVLSTIVQDSGVLQLDKGAVASNTDIQAGGTETLASGAITSNVTIESQGLLIASDVSAIQGATLQDGAQIDITDIAWNASETATITADGKLVINDGSSSWTLSLDNPGSGTHASLSAAADGSVLVNISMDRITSGGVVGSRGTDIVSSGLTVSKMEITSGGMEIVQAGGTAVGTLLDNGGAVFVLAGGTLINATLASGAEETLVSGARVSGTLIQSGAAEVVVSGATTNGADVQAGGTEVVSSGGTAIGLTIESGGTATIAGQGSTNHGGTAVNTTVKSGGHITFGHNGVEVVSGGTDSGVTIGKGWEETLAGGTSFNDVLTNGTYAGVIGGTNIGLTLLGSNNREYVGYDPLTGSAGSGLSEKTSVDSGSTQYVYAHGTSLEAQISGVQTVASGGETIGATILAGGSAAVNGTSYNMTVSTGGVATISSGATEIVSSGTDFGVTLSGGILEVTTGGVAKNDLLTGKAQAGVAGGTAIDLSLSDGATETVGFDTHTGAVAAGVSSKTKIGASSLQTVGSGGTAISADITSGGTEIIQSGGIASASIIENGGLLVAEDAMSLISTILNSGGSIDIRDQAWASGATGTIGSDGILTVTEGGRSWTVSLSKREAGATVTLSSAADGSTLISVSDLPLSFLADTLVSSGTTLDVQSGQTSSSIGILSGGTEIVEGGGHVSSTIVLDKGTVIVSAGGINTGMTISSGGSASISAGGTTVNLTVLSGGSTTYGHNGYEVVSGGTDRNVTLTNAYVDVEAGGTSFDDVLLDNTWGGVVGGTDINMTIKGKGSVETVGADLYTHASGKGVSISTHIGSGATQTVYSGSTATNATASAGGTEIVLSGGTAIGTTVLSGGTASISAGGTTVNLTVLSGGSTTYGHNGYEFVSGGTDRNVTLTNAYVDVEAGGTSFDDVLLDNTWGGVVGGTDIHMTIKGAGSVETVGYDRHTNASGKGVSINTQIGTGAAQTVYGGSTATSAVVSAGGTEVVLAGGVANNTIIHSGGTAFVSAGAHVSTMHLDSGALLSAADMQSLSGLSVDNGARIAFTNITWDSAVSASIDSSGDLVITSGGSTWSLELGSGMSGGTVELSSGNNGILNVDLTCFLEGALIQMADGTEQAVETIKQADQVMAITDTGEEARTVIWAGQMRHTVQADLPDDCAGWPVRISAGAFADGVPHTDLLVTPEHCLFVEGRFVPARMLVNGKTIRYDRTLPVYDYYHIETEQHSVIRASGLLTESFLDTGHKRTFVQNGRVAMIGSRVLDWQTDAAGPLDTDRAFVEPLYRKLMDRAVQIAVPSEEPAVQITHESDIRVVLPCGTEVRPRCGMEDNTLLFSLPAGTQDVTIMSRSARPVDVIGPFLDDRRPLGVCVGEIILYTAGVARQLVSHLEQPAPSGWYLPETGTCWTDGAALLPLGETPAHTGSLLVLQVVAGGPWLMAGNVTQAKDHRAA